MTTATPMPVEHATQTAAGPVPVRLVVMVMFVQSLKLATTDLPMLVAVAMLIVPELVPKQPVVMECCVLKLKLVMTVELTAAAHATVIAAGLV